MHYNVARLMFDKVIYIIVDRDVHGISAVYTYSTASSL